MDQVNSVAHLAISKLHVPLSSKNHFPKTTIIWQITYLNEMIWSYKCSSYRSCYI